MDASKPIPFPQAPRPPQLNYLDDTAPSIPGLLWERAVQAGAAAAKTVAIAAPDRDPLTYQDLWLQVEGTAGMLNALGLGRNDRIAIVLPNGPDLAVAFLAVASGATSAPLNPAYSAAEFDFYLTDLRARALIVQAGIVSPARTIAQRLGIPVLELSPLAGAGAGAFSLEGARQGVPQYSGFAQPGDVALVLHTSGTTA
jgi:acyl-coenzyme A synthetase/AMP-(fatty) acid ligase